MLRRRVFWFLFMGLLVSIAHSQDTDPDLTVDQGQLTFDAEGTEGGAYHSRIAHVPGDSSGVTIGRGYDMKTKDAPKIKKDLKAAKLADTDAEAFSKAAGLKGDAARNFIKDNKLIEITKLQQKDLFKISFSEEAAEVKRICEKADVVATYGATDWDNLNAVIKDVLVDLKFRGDYTPESRKLIQKFVAQDDFDNFKRVLQDKNNWANVPKDRFERRSKYLDSQKSQLQPAPCKKEGDSQEAERVIVACEKHWDANKADCNKFLKAVANELGINEFKDSWDADAIIAYLEGSPSGWTKIDRGDNEKVFNSAVAGRFVVAGLRSKDMERNNGHVSVVVAAAMVFSGADQIKYPRGYWGTLGGTGAKCEGLNYSFPSPQRKSIRYYYRDIPTQETKK